MGRIPIPGTGWMGLRAQAGDTSPPGRQAQLVGSPFADKLPTFEEPLVGEFETINVSIGTDCSGAAAWFPLLDVDVDTTFGQDVEVFSIDVDRASTDVDGDAPNGYLPWGSSSGGAAALVVGANLPITGASDWVVAPAAIAGVNGGGGPSVQSGRSPYLLVRRFPGGKFTDASPVRSVITKSWAPFVARFPRGSRIQAALVVRGTQIVSLAANSFIRGAGQVQIWCGLSSNRKTFGV